VVYDRLGRAVSSTESFPVRVAGTNNFIDRTFTSSTVYDDENFGRVAQSSDSGGFVTKPSYTQWGYSDLCGTGMLSQRMFEADSYAKIPVELDQGLFAAEPDKAPQR
jgi:hypothetical protein